MRPDVIRAFRTLHVIASCDVALPSDAIAVPITCWTYQGGIILSIYRDHANFFWCKSINCIFRVSCSKVAQ